MSMMKEDKASLVNFFQWLKGRRLAAAKKALYEEYHTAQKAMREAATVKTNIDHLLGATGGQRNKEQER